MNLNIAHRILNIEIYSSKEKVKDSYKKLVKKWHPDKHINNKEKYLYAEQNIKKIIEAYKYILNHPSWNSRLEKETSKKKSYKNSKFKILNIYITKMFRILLLLSQYLIILFGLPFIIFWEHPFHKEFFPNFHNVQEEKNNKYNGNDILLIFNQNDSSFYNINNDKKNVKLIFEDFLTILKENKKSSNINFLDFDNDEKLELIIDIHSEDSSKYYHSSLIFTNNKNNNIFHYVKTFKSGTIIDYNNKVFVEPLTTFDSFFFCDSCNFSSTILNNKNIKYISPKIQYIFKNSSIFYKTDSSVNEKIISNLYALSKIKIKFNENQFDNGLRRLYAENIISFYYNNFDLNETRDLFYKNYLYKDKHEIWKSLVVEMIQKYPILDTKK